MDIVTDTVLKNENARGLAIIIHNDYENSQQYPALPGTAKDAEAMGHAFKHLRFATIELKNGTKALLSNLCLLIKAILINTTALLLYFLVMADLIKPLCQVMSSLWTTKKQ